MDLSTDAAGNFRTFVLRRYCARSAADFCVTRQGTVFGLNRPAPDLFRVPCFLPAKRTGAARDTAFAGDSMPMYGPFQGTTASLDFGKAFWYVFAGRSIEAS
jgi:hypothetical protein